MASSGIVPPPLLSGLGDDEDEDEDESVAKPKAPKTAPKTPQGPRVSAPASRAIDDIATVMAERPVPSKGSVMINSPTVVVDREDEQEASVKIDASLLVEMMPDPGDTLPDPPRRPAQRPVSAPIPRPPRSSGPVSALPTLGQDFPADSTRIIETPQRVVSGPMAMIRPSGAHAQVPRGRHSGPSKVILEGLEEGPDQKEPNQDVTRIVTSLQLTEKKEAGERRAREKVRQTAKLEAEMRKSGKKNPVLLVKARSDVKEAPVDPQRLLSQQEAEERRTGPDAGKSSMFALDDDLPQEGTMIGRFLGLVGLTGPGTGAESKQPVRAQPGKDALKETRDAAAEAHFLEGLNPQFIEDAIQSGDLEVSEIHRDDLVELDERMMLLLAGQLTLGRFQPDALFRERKAQRQIAPGDKKAEKREHHRRMEAGPLIRLTESNLAVFREGDVVSREILGELLPGVSLFAVTGVRALRISPARLETWRRTYQFFADRMRNATESARARLSANAGARQLVADFFVRHGVSIARTLRVREVDRCIECYECEKACEERFGVKRLAVKGKILGALDFVDCCRTCVDQRCIDPCAYDAIKYDPETKEVRILEDACTGCSLCALSCPYDAIQMHDLELKPLLRLRLEKEGKLGFGEGHARKAEIRRIASKCDHCIGFEDQACVSACPTNCLLEVPPDSLFVERTEEMADAAAAGYGVRVEVDPNALFDPSKFFHGLKEGDDQRRVAEKRLRIGWLWALGLLSFVACLAEVLLRRLAPALSFDFYYLTQHAGLDAEIALQNIDYRPGSSFSVWLGAIGSILMFSSMFYSARKWIPFLKFGSQGAWFDWHVFSSTIGAAFVLVHTAGKVDNWVSLALWSMVITVLSGLIGRYVSTELPDLAEQAKLHVLELERKMSELRNRHGGFVAADAFFEGLRRRYAQVNAPLRSTFSVVLLTFWILFTDDLYRPFRPFRLRRQLRGIKDRHARAQAARIASKLALVERRRVLLPRIEPVFREWKLVHIPFAIILTLVASIHIVIELLAS